MFEDVLGKLIKVSYFRVEGKDEKERFIVGYVQKEDENMLILRGKGDGRIQGIRKDKIIEWYSLKERF